MPKRACRVLLETGRKSQELFRLTRAHVDTSNAYRPELWIKHVGKATKKDRKVALPADFTPVYRSYLDRYNINEVLFPFTDRFAQLLFAELKRGTGIQKALTPKTLRHTHVVRAYRRGEDPELIFDRIGLAPDSRADRQRHHRRRRRRLGPRHRRRPGQGGRGGAHGPGQPQLGTGDAERPRGAKPPRLVTPDSTR